MSTKNKAVGKKFILVAWQDSDVTDQIKDRSFSGRLAVSSANKENQAAGEDNGDLLKTKKRRVSKRPSIAASAASAAAVNELNIDKINLSETGVSRQPKSNKASAHFVFGNQVADGALMTTKTSNNKLEQSHRISYHEMTEVLRTQRNDITDETIASLNKFYETEYFPEWHRLMKYVKFEIVKLKPSLLSFLLKLWLQYSCSWCRIQKVTLTKVRRNKLG